MVASAYVFFLIIEDFVALSLIINMFAANQEFSYYLLIVNVILQSIIMHDAAFLSFLKFASDHAYYEQIVHVFVLRLIVSNL